MLKVKGGEEGKERAGGASAKELEDLENLVKGY